MIKTPTPTTKQQTEADDILVDAGWLGDLTRSPGEVWCVLDAIANGDCPLDYLDEYRMWRSGRSTHHD